MMSKSCEKFRRKVLGSNLNIARLRFLPLQPMLDYNRRPLQKSQNVAWLPPILLTCISVI